MQQPPADNGDFGGAPTDPDDDGTTAPYFEFDAVQQTIDRDGNVTNSLPDQPTLPIDAADRAHRGQAVGSRATATSPSAAPSTA